MDIIFIYPISAFTLVICLFFLFNETTYMFLFEHDDWKLWKKLNRLDISHFHYQEHPYLYVHVFTCDKFPDWEITLQPNGKYSYVNDIKSYDCILCNFYKKASKKLYNKLIKLVK